MPKDENSSNLTNLHVDFCLSPSSVRIYSWQWDHWSMEAKTVLKAISHKWVDFSSLGNLQPCHEQPSLFCFRSQYCWTSRLFVAFSELDTMAYCVHVPLPSVFLNHCYLCFWTSRFFLDETEEGKTYLNLALCFSPNKQQWLMTGTLLLLFVLSGFHSASLHHQYHQISFPLSKDWCRSRLLSIPVSSSNMCSHVGAPSLLLVVL